MPIIPEPMLIPDDTEHPDFWFNSQLQDLFNAAMNLGLTVSGTITDGDKAGNLSAVWVTFTSNAVANTQDTTAHKLGRTPIGILAALPNKAANIYDGGTTWTDTNIYTKTSVASVAWKLLLF